MMFTTLAAGLNRRGLTITWDLNPAWSQTVPVAELADVKVYTLDDGTVMLFTPEGKVFEPDISSFHPDDGCPAVSVCGVCKCAECCCTTENAQTPSTGLDPQPDPDHLFEEK